MKKSMVFILTAATCFSAFAVTPRAVKLNSTEVARLLRVEADYLTDRQLQRVTRHLNQIKKILGAATTPLPPGTRLPDVRPPRRPRPTPVPVPPPAPRVRMQAECHIDDDLNFDYNQFNRGMIQGATVQEILTECEDDAKSTFGPRASFGIRDLQVLSSGRRFQEAVCQVDDDLDFTMNQMTIGRMAARTIQEMADDCNQIAKLMYGAQGSAGLLKLNEGVNTPPGLLAAECHVDDDRNFDFNQLVVGTVFGATRSEMRQNCRDIAVMLYGDNSSSGLGH